MNRNSRRASRKHYWRIDHEHQHREIAYRLDPVLWVREVLGMTPRALAGEISARTRGASILVLTARQVGKTTAAAWAWRIRRCSCRDHCRWSLAPPSGKAPKPCARCAKWSSKAGAKLISDNVYGLELANGSRVLALPGSDDSIRGLTVDGWIVADEAARLSRRTDRCLASDAGAASGGTLCHALDGLEPHRSVLDGVGKWCPSWIRFQVTVDVDPSSVPAGLSCEGTDRTR